MPQILGYLARLNLDGQAISIANQYRDLQIGLDSSPLKAKFAKVRAAGGEWLKEVSSVALQQALRHLHKRKANVR